VSQYVSNVDTRRRIEATLGPLSLLPDQHRSDESVNFRLPGGRGVIGLISPVSQPYCGTCNRMRLTADGKFHLCLLHDDEIDLRAALRGGMSDTFLQGLLLQAVAAKPTGHRLDQGRSTEERNMYQIGG
jgi:cyclic pyranopterin phosphate synthase